MTTQKGTLVLQKEKGSGSGTHSPPPSARACSLELALNGINSFWCEDVSLEFPLYEHVVQLYSIVLLGSDWRYDGCSVAVVLQSVMAPWCTRCWSHLLQYVGLQIMHTHFTIFICMCVCTCACMCMRAYLIVCVCVCVCLSKCVCVCVSVSMRLRQGP